MVDSPTPLPWSAADENVNPLALYFSISHGTVFSLGWAPITFFPDTVRGFTGILSLSPPLSPPPCDRPPCPQLSSESTPRGCQQMSQRPRLTLDLASSPHPSLAACPVTLPTPAAFVCGGDEDRWPKSTPAFPTWQSIRSFTLNHWSSSSPRVTVTWRATGPMPSPPTCFHLEASSTWLHSALHSLVCSHQPSASSLIFLRPWRCRNPHDFIVSSVNSSWHFNSSLALLPNIIFTLKGGNRERGRFKCLLQHLIILSEAVTLICKRKVILPASGVAQWYNGGNSPLLNQLESAQGCLQCSAPSHPSALVSCSHSWSHQAAPTPGLYRVLSIAFMPCSLPPPTPPQPPAPSLSITAWFIWNKCTPASHSDETLHSWGFPTILDEVQYLPPGL